MFIKWTNELNKMKFPVFSLCSSFNFDLIILSVHLVFFNFDLNNLVQCDLFHLLKAFFKRKLKYKGYLAKLVFILSFVIEL